MGAFINYAADALRPHPVGQREPGAGFRCNAQDRVQMCWRIAGKLAVERETDLGNDIRREGCRD
jgi:hypothetical protein